MEAVIFMFCITLHNIEEALWLADWLRKNMPSKRKTPSKEQFVFAILGITVLGYLTAGLFILFPDNLYIEYAFIGFVGAMIINAVIPHLLLTIIYRKYCPGVLTGCVLLIPFHIIILSNAVNKGVGVITMLISTLIIGCILIASVPVFVGMAKRALRTE